MSATLAMRSLPFMVVGALLLNGRVVAAQDAASAAADAAGGDANLALAASVGRDAAAIPEPTGNCQSDTIPAGHEVRIETVVMPPQPAIGDRVLITYRLHHHATDSLQFEPDPVAFSIPDMEAEYARQQPERNRGIHRGNDGLVYGEVMIALQPFKTGEITIAPQLARLNAAGDVLRVCTPTVHFRVRDPFGNDPHPSPRDVTPPEAVSEDALRWRWIALGLDALFAVVLATLLVSAYVRSRPKIEPPPPPPRAPWVIALEALDAIGRSDLLARGQIKDYYDAISDVVRRYVGGYRGFDAIEMTTDELLRRLRRTPLPAIPPPEIEDLLRECDLVKFARYVPSHEDSEKILSQGYDIVQRSMPTTGTTRRDADREKTGGGSS